MRPVDRLLARLPQATKRGRSWRVRCPLHQGSSHTSLAISEGDAGRVLVKCHGGCATTEIVTALGLGMGDLFDDQGTGGPISFLKPFEHSNRSRQTSNESTASNRTDGSKAAGASDHADSNTSPRGLTLAQYADAKKLPLAFLQSLALSDITYLGSPAVRILYLAGDSTEAAVRFRLTLTGNDRFRWKTGAKPCLYGLWRLQSAHEAGYLVIVEGESDCHTLWYHNIPAVGIPGASSWREDRDAPYLDDISTIYVIQEPDQGGEAVRKWLSESRIRTRARLLTLQEYKDPSELHLAGPEHFGERWQAALDAATLWTVQAEAERHTEASRTYELAKELLEAPDLLEQIGKAMQKRGYAGDVRPPTLAYVAMTSRLLERPQNVGYVAQSAAGKNRAVDAALELMPEDAYYLEKAGSARALIYSQEDFQHRVVVVAEADSIPEDGPAASAIRSLATDNFMEYEVVEKHPKTGRFETRKIRKPGPTGLITTSTRSLATQLGTRVLEVSISDDPEQTRNVMRAHAHSVSTITHQDLNITPYLALQRWLAAQGEQQVIIPFAEVLADLVPAQAVRMRRDFRQLLTCIQAIALLYQCQRQKTPEGVIIATIDDYRMARELLGSIFNSIVAEGVTAAVRDTIAAIYPNEEVSEAILAERLQLSKSTVHYRVTRAIHGGWMVNHEIRKGHAARLARGAPLPDVKSVLPSPKDVIAKVRERENCSNGSIRTVLSDEPVGWDLSSLISIGNTQAFERSSQNFYGAPPPPAVEDWEEGEV
jgi:hypothetical protein